MMPGDIPYEPFVVTEAQYWTVAAIVIGVVIMGVLVWYITRNRL
jgi:hypothetical protein